MFIRGKYNGKKVWWWCDSETGAQGSLRTTDKAKAAQILGAKNSPQKLPQFHLEMARTHLLYADVGSLKRTWQDTQNQLARVISSNQARITR